MNRSLVTFFFALLIAVPTFANKHQPAPALTEGEVRKVDIAARKITIKHGPIVHLEMPAMTMAFPVRDTALLEQVRPGDKVRFEAQRIGGAITVTAIEKAN